jgi:SAM-dependent methyltransferase
MSSSPSYLDPVVLPLIVGDSVLDVGCGYGRWCHLIQSNYWEGNPKAAQPPASDGFDALEPNVDFCKAGNCYRRVWQQQLPSPLEGSWDTVLAVEVIEHISQFEEVVELLEGVAKRRIIFTTPNWPFFRNGHGTMLGFNEFEAHVSYVPREFFKDRGYQLRGAGWGCPTSRFVKATKKRLGAKARLFSGLPGVFPSLGESLVAFKDLERR